MHRQAAALGVGGLAQGAEGVLGRLIEGVLRVLGPDARHLSRGHEAGHVVNMAVGLIGVDTVPQPDDLLAPQIAAELFFNIPAAQLRVPSRGQQAHLRGQHSALTVHMDGPALQHKIVGAVAVHPLQLADLPGHQVVLIPGKVQPVVQAAPGVEGPVHCPQTALVVFHKGRAAVPDPGVVAGHLHHPHILRQAGPGILKLVGIHAYRHRLKPGDGPGYVNECLLGGLGSAAPVIGPLGPQHPYAALLLKFPGHAIPVLPGRGSCDSFCHSCYPPDMG